MNNDYAPWPESEMKALVFWHEQAAAVWKVDSKMHAEHLRRAKACQDAIDCHDALRTRFLEQSMLVRSLQAKPTEHAA